MIAPPGTYVVFFNATITRLDGTQISIGTSARVHMRSVVSVLCDCCATDHELALERACIAGEQLLSEVCQPCSPGYAFLLTVV